MFFVEIKVTKTDVVCSCTISVDFFKKVEKYYNMRPKKIKILSTTILKIFLSTTLT
jgi:hypothetical protein